MGGPPAFTITQRQPSRRPDSVKTRWELRASLALVDSRPPIPRWLALAAFLALIASAVLTAWSVLTDRADFGAAAEQRATPQSNQAGEQPDAGGREPQRLGALGTEEKIK